MKSTPIVEILESRIAPAAVYFVNGSQQIGSGPLIVDADGNDVTNGNGQTLSGADAAVLLESGFSLVYDLDGNQKLDAGTDFVIMKVTAGDAMAFFEDLNGNLKI